MLFDIDNNQLFGFTLLVGGWLLYVFGYRYKDIFLSFFGSSMGALVVYQIAMHYQFSFGLHIGVSFVVSVICSLCAIRFKNVTALAIGTISSVYLAQLVHFIVDFDSSYYRYVVVATYVLVPIASALYPLFSLLIYSAIYGSWSFVLGLDRFLGIGYPSPYSLWAPGTEWVNDIKCTQSALLMFLLFVSIATLSTFVQYYLINQLHDKHQTMLLTDEPSDDQDLQANIATDDESASLLIPNNNDDHDGQVTPGGVEDDEYDNYSFNISIKYNDDTPYIDPSKLIEPHPQQSKDKSMV